MKKKIHNMRKPPVSATNIVPLPLPTNSSTPFRQLNQHQQGITLIELLVGISIGLVVIAVAMGALMVSRGVSGTVSDVTSMHQQAAYAMRIIGMQLRQAGSLRLNLDADTKNLKSNPRYRSPVALESITPASGALGFNPQTDSINGSATPTTLTVGFRRSSEPLYTNEQTIIRNCLGGPSNTNFDEQIRSVFSLNGTELVCSGNGSATQPIIKNIAAFNILYHLQDNTNPGLPSLKIVDASAITTQSQWSSVQAVEVCIEVYGTERTSMPAGSTYVNCSGNAVDMTTQAGDRAWRSHITYKNVFQLRSQGLVGSVL